MSNTYEGFEVTVTSEEQAQSLKEQYGDRATWGMTGPDGPTMVVKPEKRPMATLGLG